jgi:hypothetical protein
VFVGEVVDEIESDSGNSADPKRFIFAVDTVYRGQVFETQSVVTEQNGMSCGLELRGSGPFLVFADATTRRLGRVDGELVSDLCSGTRSLGDGGDIDTTLATASAPMAGSSPVGGRTDGDGTNGTQWIVVIGIGVAVLSGALVAIRRASSR